jgi:hypothetical protein
MNPRFAFIGQFFVILGFDGKREEVNRAQARSRREAQARGMEPGQSG